MLKKKSKVHFIWEIWWPIGENRRSAMHPGDSCINRESCTFVYISPRISYNYCFQFIMQQLSQEKARTILLWILGIKKALWATRKWWIVSIWKEGRGGGWAGKEKIMYGILSFATQFSTLNSCETHESNWNGLGLVLSNLLLLLILDCCKNLQPLFKFRVIF